MSSGAPVGCTWFAVNTIAVLFICEVDNLSYQFGLAERHKERVDKHGHVELTDDELSQLSRTKALCIPITVVLTAYLVTNGASVFAMLSGNGVAALFKLSELAFTYNRMQARDIASSVVVTCVVQGLSFVCFVNVFLLAMPSNR